MLVPAADCMREWGKVVDTKRLGVAIYISHGIDYFHIDDLSCFDKCVESVTIEIQTDVS